METKLEPIKMEPKYGYFTRWPENGDGWIHPDDVATAKQLMPSDRIFRRDGEAGSFGVLHYGDVQIRVKPALWLETPAPAHQIGDLVEVLSRGQKNTPRTGTVREIVWSERDRRIEYQIFDEKPIPNFYTADDLRQVEPPAPRQELVIEPPADETF